MMATRGRSDVRKNTGGTPVPNGIFVGGITDNTSEEDLRNLFSKLGNVRGAKIILNDAGISLGYGFVTFETEEEAQHVLCICKSERQFLKDKKLNIAPAVKKQPYGRRSLETHPTQGAPIVWPTQSYLGIPAGYSRDPVYYPQASFPFMWPQFYLQQQYQYPSTAQSGYQQQYVYSIAPPSDYQYQYVAPVTNSDYSETSSADSGESIKSRSKQPASTLATDYDRGRQIQAKMSTASQSSNTSSVTRFSNGSAETPPSYVHSAPVHHMHQPVYAKTVNGVTVMAYPRSFVVGSPLIHVKDGGSDSDNVFTDIGFSGTLTPPATPLASIPCDFNSNVESIR